MEKSNNITLYILLFLANMLVYFPILGNKFLDFWDDQWVVMNIYTEGGLNCLNIWNILTEFYKGQYAPLNEFFYLILFSIGGYNSFIFHLGSLFFHIVNTCLVFLVIKNVMILTRWNTTDNVNSISFITALLFAIHPFNVEAVAWLSASKVLIYSFFYLLATYTFILYLKRRNYVYYIFTLLLFFCSFLGKEQAVTYPLWMLLMYWMVGYSIKNKRIWIESMPFFILSFWFGITTILSQWVNGEGYLTDNTNYSLWQRLVYACYAFIEYGVKSIFPIKLSYLYPFPSQVGEMLPLWLLSYPILLLIILVSFWRYIGRSPMSFGILFFTIHVIIVLHFIPLSRYAVIADRYAYLASIGICFIIAYYVKMANIVCYKQRRVITLVFICYLSYMGVYSNLRTRIWYDTNTLKKELRELLLQRDNYEIEYLNMFESH